MSVFVEWKVVIFRLYINLKEENSFWFIKTIRVNFILYKLNAHFCSHKKKGAVSAPFLHSKFHLNMLVQD